MERGAEAVPAGGEVGADAWWLPGVEASAVEAWHRGRTAGGLAFRAPALDGRAAAKVAERVRAAAFRARRERSLEAVVRAASRAAVRLADSAGPLGSEAAARLRLTLGWTPELVEETLSSMARGWSEEALWTVLHSELSDPGVLESYRPASGPFPGGENARWTPADASDATDHPADRDEAEGIDPWRLRRAMAPPLLFHVLAGNVPGVAVTALLRALLVRSGVLCKLPEDEPMLPVLFCRALAEEDGLLGDAVATSWWPGGSVGAAWDAWVKRSGKVVVYGGEEAVRGVRDRVPSHLDLLAYGPRLGVAVLLPDAGSRPALTTAAERLARDACAYEQQGCVSPRLAYVVGDAAALARHLATAMEAEVGRLPRPAPSTEEAVAIRALRAEAEFGGYGGAPAGMLGSEEDLSWTVVLAADAEPRAEPLRRVVRICAVESLARLEEALQPVAGRLQSMAYAGEDGLEELAELAARLGVSRLAPLGRAAWPPPDWRHDGRFQLLPLLQWTDWERGVDPREKP